MGHLWWFFSGCRCYGFGFSSFFGKSNLPCFSLALLIVPMIRNHKWEWGPPTHQRHPALPCHRCTMPPQTPLRLLNLTGFSLPTSLHPSPFKTTASLWITGKTRNTWRTHAEGVSVVATTLLYRVVLASCPQLFPFRLGDQGENQQGS